MERKINLDTKLGAPAPEIKKDKWENYEYSPAAQPVNGTSMAIGLALRGLCVAILTFGLMLFINDAFSLGCGFFTLLLRALIPTAVFALIMVGGKKGILIGLGLGAVSVLFVAMSASNLGEYVVGSVSYTFDSAMRYLVEIGYDNYSAYVTGAGTMGLSAVELHQGGFTVIGAALSLVFCLCTMRKTVLLPTLIISLATLVAGFTFNISTSNWGFAFSLLALVGIIVMRGYDGRFKAKRGDRLKIAYLGGFVGGTVMLMAFMAVVIPAAVMKDQWKDIEFISKPISVARDIVDSVISGDAPNLKDMGIIKNMDELNSRDTSLKNQTFTGETILKVETSYNKDLPIYFRNWIATDFDGKSWTTVTNDKLASYMERFEIVAINSGYNGGTYSADNMTEAFYDMVIPDIYKVNSDKGYTNNHSNGFISMILNVKMELGVGTGNMLSIPSVMGGEGLKAYGNPEKNYKYSYQSYFDGMYITGWLNLNKEYTTVSYVPIMSSKDFSSSFRNELAYFYAMRELLIWHKGSYSENAKPIKVAEVLARYGLSHYAESETYFDKYLEMSVSEQKEAYNRYVYLTTDYTEYAEETYGKQEGDVTNEIVKMYADKIMENLDPNAFTHDKVLAVVQFLYDNYTYSMTPSRLPTTYTGIDGFLKETKEGYCVQFATVTALILREMGITARYVEGYIASDFNRSEDYEKTGTYTATVTDKQAHAWVEVYYDGFGWLPYETTSRYVKSYYGSMISSGGGSSGESGSVVPGVGSGGNGDHAPEDEVIPDVEPIPEPVTQSFPIGKVLIAILIVAGVGALLYFVWTRLRDRAEAILQERRKLITDAINHSIADEDMGRCARELNHEIFRMFDLGNASPNIGELPMEYAARMENESLLGKAMPLTEIMTLIQKQEFGHGVSKTELATIAEYLDELWKDVYRNTGKAKRFWHRYLSCSM